MADQAALNTSPAVLDKCGCRGEVTYRAGEEQWTDSDGTGSDPGAVEARVLYAQ